MATKKGYIYLCLVERNFDSVSHAVCFTCGCVDSRMRKRCPYVTIQKNFICTRVQDKQEPLPRDDPFSQFKFKTMDKGISVLVCKGAERNEMFYMMQKYTSNEQHLKALKIAAFMSDLLVAIHPVMVI